MARSRPALLLEANQALLVRGELDRVDDFFTPDYVAHGTGKVVVRGPAAVRRFVRGLRAAFGDLRVEVELLVAGKDRVAWQRTLRATHRAAYAGFPGTGRRLVWRDALTSRFEGGRIAEEWVISDLAERLLLARRR